MIKTGNTRGKYTYNKNTITKPNKYGTTAFAIISIGSPVILDPTNKFIATGGVIIPIEMSITNKTPKCTRSTPNILIKFFILGLLLCFRKLPF